VKPVASAISFHTDARWSGASPLFPPEAEHQLHAAAAYAGEKHYITARVASADKSVHAARGPLWHKKDRLRGIIPKNLHHVDREATWGYSPYHHWVQGYSQHTIVNATPGEARFPLDCTASTANMAENRVLVTRLHYLPPSLSKLLLDGTYDDEEVFCACRTAKLLPLVHMERPPRHAAPIRKWAWRVRSRKVNRRLYKLRRCTIEPTFGNGKLSFENHRVWFYGLRRNHTHLVLTHYARAVAMLVNFKTKHSPENVQELFDSWQ